MWIHSIKHDTKTVFNPSQREKQLDREIDSLRQILKKKDQILLDGLKTAEKFDSIAHLEKERRKDVEVENSQLRKALRDKLKITEANTKRKMLLERYEKDPI